MYGVTPASYEAAVTPEAASVVDNLANGHLGGVSWKAWKFFNDTDVQDASAACDGAQNQHFLREEHASCS